MTHLGGALRLDLDHVEVKHGREYSIAGVYSFGRGLFARGPITASDTTYKKLHRLHEGQLVVSRLKAFEGAVAVVPQEFDGWFLSPEFPTFTCINDGVEPSYLRHVCRWDEFWSLLAASSTGIGARRERIHASTLLSIQLQVPPIDEQRRVAQRLDGVEAAANEGDGTLAQVPPDVLRSTLPSLVDGVIEQRATGRAPLSQFVDFVSDTVHPGDDPSPADCFIGLQHIESHTGYCLGSDDLGLLPGRKFRFRPGDVVYGYLRPYLNKVWVADRDGLCSVDQYVLRPRDGEHAELIAHALRGRNVLNQARSLTHNLQLPRLRSGLLAGVEVADVPAESAADLVSRLDAVRDHVRRLAELRERQNQLVASLVPAALNEALAGLS